MVAGTSDLHAAPRSVGRELLREPFVADDAVAAIVVAIAAVPEKAAEERAVGSAEAGVVVALVAVEGCCYSS